MNLNDNEAKFVAIMLEEFWCNRNHQSAHESLSLNPDHPGQPTENWIDDVATELAEHLEKEGKWESGGR